SFEDLTVRYSLKDLVARAPGWLKRAEIRGASIELRVAGGRRVELRGIDGFVEPLGGERYDVLLSARDLPYAIRATADLGRLREGRAEVAFVIEGAGTLAGSLAIDLGRAPGGGLPSGAGTGASLGGAPGGGLLLRGDLEARGLD